ncbi:YceI family protein [Formosa maritima]|uniref:YceI family protein n=1 Tax=Formosa maritima TaxID=2592046 RepID=A0A5D0G185_9FLAO|nr:YceI family protein [Formosa maritima]TYA52381.1 YceI family protein [Formosa maritima]
MKRKVIIFIIFACSITINAQTEMPINTSKSSINWKGSMLFNFGEHYGTTQFKEGKITKSNNKITGGTFTVDMNTIVNTDGNYSEDLINHLKNEDFFDVKKHPISSLVITKVSYYDNGSLRMDANLTIKGISKPIMFDAKLIDNTKMIAKFKIDRTEWNIRYGSKDKVSVKDYAISDAIEFEVELYF